MVRSLARTALALGIAAVVTTGAAPRAAHAGSVTANLSVSANVLDSCSVTGGTLAFGNYDPTASSALTSSAPFSVTCSLGTIATIKLGQGANAASGSSDSLPARRLTDGSGHYLTYSLFKDATQLLQWGNTTLTGQSYTSLGNSASTMTVYGSVGAGQNAMPGLYSDTVVITVAF